MPEQIYREQVKLDRTPMAPDTSLMTYFDEQRRDALKGLGDSVQIEIQRHAKQVQGVKDLTYKQATQVYKNMYEIYQDDPVKYKEGVKKGLTQIYDGVPDGDMKKMVMAEVEITGSGYDAKVYRNQIEKQERINNEYIREATFAMVGTAQENAGELFNAIDQTNTPEERARALQVYQDAAQRSLMAYKRANAVDKRGNSLFTTSEKAALKDQADNFNRYAVLGYAQNNIQENYQGVADVYNLIKENKDKFVKEYGLDDKSYTSIVKDMDKIIEGQLAPADAIRAYKTMAEIDGDIKDMGIKNGEITNKKYKNLTATTGLFQKMKEAESRGDNYADRDGFSKKMGTVANQIVNLVEQGKTMNDWKFWQQNVGEVVSRETNQYLDEISPYLVGTNVNLTEIKAEMYTDALGQLQSADNIKLTDAGDTQKKLAKEVAENAYYKQLNRYVSVNIPDDRKKDKQYIANEYKRALKQRQNQIAMNTVDSYMSRIKKTSTAGL